MSAIQLDATLDAIALLKGKLREAVNGPDTTFAMLLHAQNYLERSLRAYLVPAPRTGGAQ